MRDLHLKINGVQHRVSVNSGETLLDVLRDRLHLTGTKRGCDTGDCGACTVLLNGEPVNSCLLLAVEADGAEVATIEGISHPIQEDYARIGAFQCGYCAPGVVVSTSRLLDETPQPGKEKIDEALSGHLCRCTGYLRIRKALLGEEDSFQEDNEHAVVGQPVMRKDVRDKVAGRAQFTADRFFPGMIYGALVTSPHPHARVLSVDTSKALEMEGVVLAITPDDVPDEKYGVSPARYDETILPKDTVRHVGEAVSAVFAVDRRTAMRAAELVEVEYEPLEPVFEPDAALAEGAPQLHERAKRNVNTDIHQNFGDVEKIFSEAHLVRDDVFNGHRTHQAFLEPQAALALVEGDQINLWTANQTPHYVQYNVARTLGIPASRLRVIKPAMGGGFGGKAEATKLDFLAIIAAEKLKRPVLMTLSRKQVFEHGRGRHGQRIALKTAYDTDGRLLGSHERVTLDGGAYTGYGIITAYYSGSLLTTPYHLPNFRFDAQRVCTNLPACGAQRGNGTPYPRFAFESQLDMAAKNLGIDPVTIRMRNVIEPGHVTVNGLEIKSCGVKECLEKIDEFADFRGRWGKLPFGRGIGLGLGCFISGAGGSIVRGDLPHSACTIRIEEDGERAFLYTGAPEIGQGSDTVLCQIAAEELGLTYEQVSIISSDSAVTPADLGAYASRVTFMAGNATVDAARQIKANLKRFWIERNGNGSEPMFRLGKISDGKMEMSFGELAREYRRAHGPLVATGSYSPPELGGKHKGASVGTSPAYSFCAVACEVEVDTETGQVRVDRFWAAHDSGTVINPVTFHGQVEGALVMGLGETLMEKVLHREGTLINPNFHDYLIPTIADAPPIECYTVPVRDPDGPFGAKEVGEGTILPVFASIANAVDDAVGVRITELPITAQKICRALRNRDDA
jgi:4-hydroxybenzoyl-CoA reductase subunit alpha